MFFDRKNTGTFSVLERYKQNKSLPDLIDSYLLIYFYLISRKNDVTKVTQNLKVTDFSFFTKFLEERKVVFRAESSLYNRKSPVSSVIENYLKNKKQMKKLSNETKQDFLEEFFKHYKYINSGIRWTVIKSIGGFGGFIGTFVYFLFLVNSQLGKIKILNPYLFNTIIPAFLIYLFIYFIIGCIEDHKNKLLTSNDKNKELKASDFKYIELDKIECFLELEKLINKINDCINGTFIKTKEQWDKIEKKEKLLSPLKNKAAEILSNYPEIKGNLKNCCERAFEAGYMEEKDNKLWIRMSTLAFCNFLQDNGVSEQFNDNPSEIMNLLENYFLNNKGNPIKERVDEKGNKSGVKQSILKTWNKAKNEGVRAKQYENEYIKKLDVKN